jgi:hypothetical protein
VRGRHSDLRLLLLVRTSALITDPPAGGRTASRGSICLKSGASPPKPRNAYHGNESRRLLVVLPRDIVVPRRLPQNGKGASEIPVRLRSTPKPLCCTTTVPWRAATRLRFSSRAMVDPEEATKDFDPAQRMQKSLRSAAAVRCNTAQRLCRTATDLRIPGCAVGIAPSAFASF